MTASENFFPTKDEEYTAAAWLTSLKLMQRLGERLDGREDAAAKLCRYVLQKPDELIDHLNYIADQDDYVEHSKTKFLVEMGALTRENRLARGLNDAVCLLCADDVSQYVLERTGFKRLVPLVDEITDYCDDKYMLHATHSSLAALSYGNRLYGTFLEAEEWIPVYDRESNNGATF